MTKEARVHSQTSGRGGAASSARATVAVWCRIRWIALPCIFSRCLASSCMRRTGLDDGSPMQQAPDCETACWRESGQRLLRLVEQA